MRLRDTVQSKWFKVDDLPGREQGWLDVTIRKVAMGSFSDGRETLDLYFHEHPKPLGANVTNRKRLMLMFGEDIDSEQLVGHRIRLVAEMTQDAKGAPCWGVRIVPPPDTTQAASAAARAKIEEASLRHAVAQRSGPPRMPQDRPADFPRPMSHDPRPYDPGANVPREPAGFVDDQDPWFDADQRSGRW